MTQPQYSVGLFAKYPLAGQVKTRLIPTLGSNGACQFAVYLLVSSIRKLLALPAEQVQVWLWQDGGTPEQWQSLLGGYLSDEQSRRLERAWQPTGHLGERMARAFKVQLAPQNTAILVGADAVQMQRTHFEGVNKALVNHDLVYVPALDGGYVAIGAKGVFSEVLAADIEWGGPKVLDQSLVRAEKASRKVHCLAAQQDIDEPGDLDRAISNKWVPRDWKNQLFGEN